MKFVTLGHLQFSFLQGSVYSLLIRARVDTGLSTHVHINIAEYYNDSVSHPRNGHCLLAFIDLTIIVHGWGTCDFNESTSPVIVNGPVLQTSSLKRKSSDARTQKSAVRHSEVQRSKFDGISTRAISRAPSEEVLSTAGSF